MTTDKDKLIRKLRDELARQVAANEAGLRRLESLRSEEDSEEIGRCFATEQVRRAVTRGNKLLNDIKKRSS